MDFKYLTAKGKSWFPLLKSRPVKEAGKDELGGWEKLSRS